MIITDEMLENNKTTFIELLRSITREGSDIERLINKLINSDFFVAPASTKYHNAIKGGLCDHCLNVYYNLKSLVERKHLQDIIPEDSIIICGLLHDLSKMNFYEIYYQNKKVYSESGSKRDENGRFDWKSISAYKVRDKEERFQFGNHEQTAEFMVRQFIPLTVEESAAILNHMGGMSWDSAQNVFNNIAERYPLVCLLFAADCISTFIDEGR